MKKIESGRLRLDGGRLEVKIGERLIAFRIKRLIGLGIVVGLIFLMVAQPVVFFIGVILAYCCFTYYVILRRMEYKAKYGVWPRDTFGRKPPHYMESIDALRRERREKEDSRGA